MSIDSTISSPSARRAFTLVELSIVLVVLGLLVGGILAGRSMFRASEIRSVATDFTRFHTAFNAFQNQYSALPGDMPNATAYWNAQHATPANCQTTPSTSQLTCDGNGDGKVGDTLYYEDFRFWQHLANAGLIEGSYTGVAGAGGSVHCVLGTNCPKSRVTNAGYGVNYYASLGAGQIIQTNSHQIIFGGQHSTFFPTTGIIRGEEAWNIDQKIDDGKPGFGTVFGPSNTSRPNCVTTNVPETAEYAITNTTLGCDLFYKLSI